MKLRKLAARNLYVAVMIGVIESVVTTMAMAIGK